MKRKQPKDIGVKVELLQEERIRILYAKALIFQQKELIAKKIHVEASCKKKSEKNYITEHYQRVQSYATGTDGKCRRAKTGKKIEVFDAKECFESE